MNYCKQTVFLILLMLVLLLPLASAEGRTFITVDGCVPLEIREGSAVTAEELITTIHGHPTVAEAVREAFLASEGRAIHTKN